MKIVKSEGCTAFYTIIDGINVNEMTEGEKELIVSLIN